MLPGSVNFFEIFEASFQPKNRSLWIPKVAGKLPCFKIMKILPKIKVPNISFKKNC